MLSNSHKTRTKESGTQPLRIEIGVRKTRRGRDDRKERKHVEVVGRKVSSVLNVTRKGTKSGMPKAKTGIGT